MVTPATNSRNLTHVDSQRFKNKGATPPLSIFMGQVTVGYHLRDFRNTGKTHQPPFGASMVKKICREKHPPLELLSVSKICHAYDILLLCVLTWSRPHNQELAENIGAFLAIRCLSGVTDMICPIGYRYRLSAE